MAESAQALDPAFERWRDRKADELARERAESREKDRDRALDRERRNRAEERDRFDRKKLSR